MLSELDSPASAAGPKSLSAKGDAFRAIRIQNQGETPIPGEHTSALADNHGRFREIPNGGHWVETTYSNGDTYREYDDGTYEKRRD